MSGAGEEDKKPAEGGAHINLKVKGQVSTPAVSLFLIFFFLVISPVVPLPHHLPRSEDGNEVFFRIKRSTQLKKLMNAYCDRQSVDMNAIAFLFDGRRLRGEQTPDELEMEDGDEIDAMLHQTGGSVPSTT
ncbi:small ubiquitin-related modifier 1 isoform X1 [Zea mays]|uniref:small ubiquitin-related modifier 1 isoform X1 n=1 Tax=Zea mays TaxID=4577 RepID=UPI001652FC44|nr:uncharacterized protein LOC100281954 isoform X1 [Zea mays]